jgi:hypothetical protein
MEVFTIKMELVDPDKRYGDTWADISELLLMLTDIHPFTTEGMQFASIIRLGTHREPCK